MSQSTSVEIVSHFTGHVATVTSVAAITLSGLESPIVASGDSTGIIFLFKLATAEKQATLALLVSDRIS